MYTQILQIAGKVAGLAGLSLAVVLLLFREIIRKNIFPRLNPEDAYRTIRLLAILAFIISVMGIMTWGYQQTHPQAQNSTANLDNAKQHLVVAGRVVDEKTNDPIQQAALTINGRPESYVSEDNGNFRIEFPSGASIDGSVRIQVSKQGYVPWDRSIGVPVENLVVQMRRLSK